VVRLNRRGGRPRKYDWSALFGRGRFTLRPGRDYTCTPDIMVQQVRNAASARGAAVDVRTDGDTGNITVVVAKVQDVAAGPG
jgi:hypothetical protein